MMPSSAQTTSAPGPPDPLPISHPAANTADAPLSTAVKNQAYPVGSSGATPTPGPPAQLHSPFHPPASPPKQAPPQTGAEKIITPAETPAPEQATQAQRLTAGPAKAAQAPQAEAAKKPAPAEVSAPGGRAPRQRPVALPVHEDEPLPQPPAPAAETPAKAEKKKKKQKEQTVRMIDERAVKHSRRKFILWIIWLAIMGVTIAYCVMVFVTYNHLRNVQDQPTPLWGPLTALLFTPILALVFFVLGTVLLLVTTVRETGATYGYGFLSASALWLAFMTVFSSVVVNAYNAVAHNEWEDSSAWSWSSSYAALMRGTYILGYILTGLLVFLFFILILFKGVTKRLDLQGAPAIQEVKVITE